MGWRARKGVGVLKRAADYRALALEFAAKARAEGDLRSSSQWEHLSRCYLRLAEQADQNSLTDIAVEFGSNQKAVDENGDGTATSPEADHSDGQSD